ncbi:MAG: DUF4236 domain-containing protein [Acidobacteriota bacterium]|nr:DUF4236 domain-containing protein [Acidobacteriota bacterium]
MGFFFRRSAQFGPFRLNFSKSGVGASVGVKGARVTMRSGGTTYITVGSHGFYYRETLSRRGGRPQQLRSDIHPNADSNASDEIRTANAADLVDSSSADLVARLNERARAFNPASLLYLLSTVLLVLGASLYRPQYQTPALPDVSNRQGGTPDEYAMLIARYGQPDEVHISRPFGLLTERLAKFLGGHVGVLFVPNGCLDKYGEIKRWAELNTDPPPRGTSPCSTSSNSWSIAGYIDSTRDTPINPSLARELLNSLPVKRRDAPAVQSEAKGGEAGNPVVGGAENRLPPTDLNVMPDPQAIETNLRAQKDAQAHSRRLVFLAIAMLLSGPAALVGGIVMHRQNRESRKTRLFYELGPQEQGRFSVVRQALAHLAGSHTIWRIEGESSNNDWKRNAGASSLVRRSLASIVRVMPERVEANVEVYSLNLGQIRLFFLPDLILYWQMGSFGAVAYDALRIQQSITRFVEDGAVPADSTIVGQTWRYVNRSGGPDRRFNNNRQLPIAQYGVLVFSSSHGLNIHLNTSSAQASAAFAACWAEKDGRPRANDRNEPREHEGVSAQSSRMAQAMRVLGVSASATMADISGAYRHLAQMYHPDKVAGLAPEFQELAERRMREINVAYELLKERGA